jgi:ATP-dependent exoDNAse (exonuclease V) beta subunit
MGARQAVAGEPAGAKAQEGADPLEEMRLFYVGATRATSRLIVANAVRH